MSSAVFLDRNFHLWLAKDPTNSELKVVVSPSFYIAKISTIPFETTKKAKKATHSIFDGFLPQGDFVFETYRLGDSSYLFLAIERQTVLSKLKELNFSFKKAEFFTSQTALQYQAFPLALKDETVLINENGVSLISKTAQSAEHSKIDVQKLLFANKINLKIDGGVGQKAKNLLTAALSFFVFVFFADLLVKSYQISKISKQTATIKENPSLPGTNMELQSAIKSLSAIDEKQKALRAFLKYLHAFSFVSGESVKNLKIDITAFEVEINTQRGDEIKKYMAKKFKIEGSVVSSDSLYLKVAL